MKILFLALIESIYGIFNVFLAIIFVWLMFALTGVYLYQNRFGYCQASNNFLISKDMV